MRTCHIFGGKLVIISNLIHTLAIRCLEARYNLHELLTYLLEAAYNSKLENAVRFIDLSKFTDYDTIEIVRGSIRI